MKQEIACVVEVYPGCFQGFHRKYIGANGEVLKPYHDVAQTTHRRLQCLQDDCLGLAEDSEIWEALIPWREHNITALKEVIARLEDGTFTFCCEEHCSAHPDCGGDCDADLTAEKIYALPGAHNCARYREATGCTTPPVRVQKSVSIFS